MAKRIEAAAHQLEPGETDRAPLRKRNIEQTFMH